MKPLLTALCLYLGFSWNLYAQELKIKADYFESNQKKGISVFRGNVHIKKGFDEINASKVTIYTDEQKTPIKYVAEGNVAFKIEDEHGKKYVGYAQKVVYNPAKQLYKFFVDVHLKQLDDKKEIQGDEVVFNAANGEAHAKGGENSPVIMIFDIKKEKK